MTQLQKMQLAREIQRWYGVKEKFATLCMNDRLSLSQQCEYALRVREANVRIEMIDTVLQILGCEYQQINGTISIVERN